MMNMLNGFIMKLNKYELDKNIYLLKNIINKKLWEIILLKLY